MALREDGDPRQLRRDRASKGIEQANIADLLVEQLDAHRVPLGIRGEDVDNVAAHTVVAAVEIHVIAGVLQLRQLAQDVALVDELAAGQVNDHSEVGIGITQAVNGGHGGNHQAILPLQQGLGGGQAHLLDVLVDRRVLLDIGIRGRHISFRLVVVVIGDEVLHRVVGKELLELAVELGRQGLVMGHHDRGTLQLLHHVGHGEGLAGTCDTQQGLASQPGANALDQLADRLGLVASGLERGHYLEGSGHERLTPGANEPPIMG